MAVSQGTRQDLYDRAGGQCECSMRLCANKPDGHPAGTRCPTKLLPGKWEAHHLDPSGPDTLDNLLAMCEPCHERTPSYGRG
jgi:hypothetical protein